MQQLIVCFCAVFAGQVLNLGPVLEAVSKIEVKYLPKQLALMRPAGRVPAGSTLPGAEATLQSDDVSFLGAGTLRSANT